MASPIPTTRFLPSLLTSAGTRVLSVALVAVAGGFVAGGCNTAGEAGDTFDNNPAGATGPGGSSSTGGSGPNTGDGGSGAVVQPGGGSSGSAGEPDAGPVTNDADVDADTICSDGGVAEVGPLARDCAAPTANECDGSAETNANLPNGLYGNAYDDDCDGKVDEGCECPPEVGAGETRDCWLTAASQADAQGVPVGWCNPNSGGSMSCKSEGGGDVNRRLWDGECRGAQPPFADDLCALGDFDCDGTELNSRTRDCTCEDPEIICPTDPLVVAPYPDVFNLPVIDGSTWIQNGVTATAWRWEVTGGDCDNILPHPSFQLYPTPVAQGQFPVGIKQAGMGPNGNQTGLRFGPGGTSGPKIYPAFALSGDYLAKGSFLINNTLHECTVRVEVRAPGIRAEACWSPMPNDIDLHVARLQGANCSGSGHGWFSTCRGDDAGDDCYYSSSTGCTGFGSSPSPWGYVRSQFATCHGWGSSRDAFSECDNPRLDRDNISCDPFATDPSGAGFFPFCAAENINIDNPKHGDRFVVGAHAYSISGTVLPHINIYCNGERRLSLGYDPTTGQDFPKMKVSGADSGGDFWEATVVEALVDGGGVLTDCVVTPINSMNPKSGKDGSSDYCVDTDPQNNSSQTGGTNWLFAPGGGYPANADDFCWH